ncbi:MAG: cytochrome P450 [Gammaproteobacteria bacterium]|nr:MAG: cytochrome P450 [Gammaproteobacteria bacterium]
MSWSPLSAESMADPASGHAELLTRCPIHRCDAFDPPFYTLSRHADLEMALRDTETFSSQYGQGPRFTEPQGMMCDPPQHTIMRKFLQPAFTPKALARLRPRVEMLTDELIDKILGGPAQFDLHDDFAFPLPVIIIAELMGVPEGDLPQFKKWSDNQVAAMGAEDPTPYLEEAAAFFQYMQAQLSARRAELADDAESGAPDDLVGLVAGARLPDGELISEADALSMLTQLLVGGNETTTSLITNLVWRLLENRPLWFELRANPDLTPAAIEESLRYDPPVLGLYRSTTRAVTLHDVTIPEGSKVYLNYAAANRDPETFDSPDIFDPSRDRGRHLSFGLGLHFCLGAPTARLEAEVALRRLTERLPDLKLEGTGERIAPFFLWGRRRLPLSWK